LSLTSHKLRPIAAVIFLLIASFAVLLRYELFTHGILYGQGVAKAASLLVAGIVFAAGAIPLWLLRGAASKASNESVAAAVAVILGVATAAYSAGELLAPNTPIASAAPACAGVPVYGAYYYAVTQPIGANSRTGHFRSCRDQLHTCARRNGSHRHLLPG
jgi:hypothetical protein